MADNLIKIVPKKNNSCTIFYNLDTKYLYTRETGFVPRKGSMFFKPSFAGRQVNMGIYHGKEQLTNGVWFEVGKRELDEICECLNDDYIEIK